MRTGVDTDHDGAFDRVVVDISRPRETATAGLRVPVIFEHSSYRKDVWGDVPYPSVLVDELPQGSLVRAPASRAAADRRPTGRQPFLDAGRSTPGEVLVSRPDEASANRLVYRTPVLTGPVRLSGRPQTRLWVSVDNRPAADLTAYLVDYGRPGSTAAPAVTRGWMDPQNRSGPAHGRPLVQGREYDLRWTLEPKDHVFRAGNRIGLVVFSSDQEYPPLPPDRTTRSTVPSSVRLHHR